MQKKVYGNTFKKLIQICKQNQILNVQKVDQFSYLHYGPLGSLLKRNIFSEWLSSVLKENDYVFPLEVPHPQKQTSLLQKLNDRSRECILPVLGNYFEAINLFGHHSLIGFAVYGPCVNQNLPTNGVATDMDINILSNLKAWTRLSVIFFCSSNKPMHWFHYWSKQRYLWWRKFSSIPSKFSLSEVMKTTAGAQQLSLLLDSPWGKDRCETVTLHENTLVNELFEKYYSERMIPHSQQVSVPAVVTCETELDLAVLSYLSNSYAEKWREGEIKNVLHLHYKLAPYKVCMSLEDTDAEGLTKLKNVASHLTKELKDTGISIFPTPDANFQASNPSQFERFDEMGIPYTIVLNENSLLTGIAGLRSRDTTLQEQIHVTELTSKLVKYLKTTR